MIELYEANSEEPSLFKYTRKHLLEIFNTLYQRAKFPHSINYFPERTILRTIQHKRSQKLNINNNFNAFIEGFNLDLDLDN